MLHRSEKNGIKIGCFTVESKEGQEEVVQYNLCKTATLKKTKLVYNTNYRLMQVKRIAEAFCSTFDLH